MTGADTWRGLGQGYVVARLPPVDFKSLYGNSKKDILTASADTLHTVIANISLYMRHCSPTACVFGCVCLLVVPHPPPSSHHHRHPPLTVLSDTNNVCLHTSPGRMDTALTGVTRRRPERRRRGRNQDAFGNRHSCSGALDLLSVFGGWIPGDWKWRFQMSRWTVCVQRSSSTFFFLPSSTLANNSPFHASVSWRRRSHPSQKIACKRRGL